MRIINCIHQAMFSLIAANFILYTGSQYLQIPQAQATYWKRNPAATFSHTPIFINEIHYDNVSTDIEEGVEIAGPAGENLIGWNLVCYDGSTGASYSTNPLAGIIPDMENGYGTLFFYLSWLQNGAPEGIALVNHLSEVVLFLSYEGSFTAVDGPAVGMTSVDIGVYEPGTTPVGYSLQLSGTGSVYESFAWQTPLPHTYGSKNTGQTFQDTQYMLYFPVIFR